MPRFIHLSFVLTWKFKSHIEWLGTYSHSMSFGLPPWTLLWTIFKPLIVNFLYFSIMTWPEDLQCRPTWLPLTVTSRRSAVISKALRNGVSLNWVAEPTRAHYLHLSTPPMTHLRLESAPRTVEPFPAVGWEFFSPAVRAYSSHFVAKKVVPCSEWPRDSWLIRSGHWRQSDSWWSLGGLLEWNDGSFAPWVDCVLWTARTRYWIWGVWRV